LLIQQIPMNAFVGFLLFVLLSHLVEAFVSFDQVAVSLRGTFSTTTRCSNCQRGLNEFVYRRRLYARKGNGGGLFGDDATREGGQNQRSLEPEKSKEFATGAELKKLRADLENLRENMQWAQAMNDETRIEELAKAIKNGEQRDPELAYAKYLRLVAETKKSTELSAEDKKVMTERWQERAQRARSHLFRFQMDGIWVGNYGNHGLELINVTYVGDNLIATKVTGDETVPRGQVSFTADLHPPSNTSVALSPLKMTVEPALSTPTPLQTHADDYLPRFPGKGQIAKPGFKEHRFVEGQLVMFESHFSFVWIPTRHHVLFRRPTPQQTIDLLRDTISKEDEMENMRNHLRRCFDMDMTDSLARQCTEQGQEPFRRIALKSDLKKLSYLQIHLDCQDRDKEAHDAKIIPFHLMKYYYE